MGAAEEQIAAVLAEWTAAERDGDVAAIGSRLTDDFVGVGPLGYLLSKKEWLERHGPGGLAYDAFAVEEPQVRVYGEDTVLVVCHQTQHGSYRGNPVPGDMRASIVLVADGQDWRLAGIHMSFIAGTPGAPPVPGAPPAGR
jgi:ketosteroid isomerase-like protein